MWPREIPIARMQQAGQRYLHRSIRRRWRPENTDPAEGHGTFYRVIVLDLDSDGDGVGDWAEKIAGYNPNNANTSGVPGENDLTVLSSAVATSGVVTVSATKYSATQPSDVVTPPVETGAILRTTACA